MSNFDWYLTGLVIGWAVVAGAAIGRIFVLKAKVDMLERLNMDAYQRITDLHAENIRLKHQGKQ